MLHLTLVSCHSLHMATTGTNYISEAAESQFSEYDPQNRIARVLS
jgi:hypothetical protein